MDAAHAATVILDAMFLEDMYAAGKINSHQIRIFPTLLPGKSFNIDMFLSYIAASTELSSITNEVETADLKGCQRNINESRRIACLRVLLTIILLTGNIKLTIKNMRIIDPGD